MRTPPASERRDNGTVTASFDPAAHLPDELLERFRERAAVHDRENTFPDDDLADLKAAGYLAILVPAELGGGGLGLAEASVLQQRLAGAAPATALAINMHLVWTGVAKVLADRGIDALRFVQEGAVAGEVFAFGISEAGNDLVLFGSDTDAAPQPDGGYAFTGHEDLHLARTGVDAARPARPRHRRRADAPKLVYAFVPRSDDGASTRDDWDTLGMRGTQSRTTELHGARRAGRPRRAAARPRPESRPDRVRHLQRVRAAPRLGLHRDRAARARPRGRDGRQAPVEEDRQGVQPGSRHPLAHRRHGARVRRAAAAARGARAATSTSSPTTARGGSRCSPASSTAR